MPLKQLVFLKTLSKTFIGLTLESRHPNLLYNLSIDYKRNFSQSYDSSIIVDLDLRRIEDQIFFFFFFFHSKKIRSCSTTWKLGDGKVAKYLYIILKKQKTKKNFCRPRISRLEILALQTPHPIYRDKNEIERIKLVHTVLQY